MKIKILTSCAGLKFAYSAGETADIDDATAKDLIRAGHAKTISGGKGSTEKPDSTAEAEPPKGAETDDKSDNAADRGTGKAG